LILCEIQGLHTTTDRVGFMRHFRDRKWSRLRHQMSVFGAIPTLYGPFSAGNAKLNNSQRVQQVPIDFIVPPSISFVLVLERLQQTTMNYQIAFAIAVDLLAQIFTVITVSPPCNLGSPYNDQNMKSYE